MSNFEIIAEQEGWAPNTQVSILLEYIENQQSQDAFQDFISEKISERGEEKHLGLEEAELRLLTCLNKGDLKLFKCSVGVYASADAEEHHAEYEVFITEKNLDDANEKAILLCEEKHGFQHMNLAFAAIDQPSEVNPEDLSEACRQAKDKNGKTINVDNTVVCVDASTGGDTDEEWDLIEGKEYIVEYIHDEDRLLSPMFGLKGSSSGPVFPERFLIK